MVTERAIQLRSSVQQQQRRRARRGVKERVGGAPGPAQIVIAGAPWRALIACQGARAVQRCYASQSHCGSEGVALEI